MSFDSYTCEGAARGGHIHVLKYLKSEGVPFDEEICWDAAWGGHLAVLKWLVDEGCPWNIKECYECAKSKDPNSDMCKWIKAFIP